MMKKLVVVAGLLGALSAVNARANGTAVEQTEAVEGEQSVLHEEWQFLGCVHSRHECRHEASHHGYHHSYAVRDHHVCHDHRHPVACYGKN